MSLLSQKRKIIAVVDSDRCVACGTCIRSCPIGAISINKGMYAVIDQNSCVGCGRCERRCPAAVIERRVLGETTLV